MIVRSFLDWFGTAPVSGRIEAVRMMVEVYLSGELGSDTPKEAEVALTLVLDDPSISVRTALAFALAPHRNAPRHLIIGLAHDEAEVSAIVLARSPAMTEADLIDCARHGDALTHLAIAMREAVSLRVAHVLVEVAGPRAIAALVDNAGAELADELFRTILKRHGDDAALREALNSRSDLPADVRQSLVAMVSRDLLALVRQKGWGEKRIERPVGDARDQATIELAAEASDLTTFVAHLGRTGQLTPSLLIRSLMCGDTSLFGAALVCLSGVSATRVAGMLGGRPGSLFAATCAKAGLPRAMTPVFAAAVAAIHRQRPHQHANGIVLQRSIIEQVSVACLNDNIDDMRSVLAMLRRFEADVARTEARAEIASLRAVTAEPVVDLATVEPLDALPQPDMIDASSAPTVPAAEPVSGEALAIDAIAIEPAASAVSIIEKAARPEARQPARAGMFSFLRRKPKEPKVRPLPADLEALFEDVLREETVITPPLDVVGGDGNARDGSYFAAHQAPAERSVAA